VALAHHGAPVPVESAEEIYAQVKAEFERLQDRQAPRGEWLTFSSRLIDAIMKCQAIVMEHQKRLIAHARGVEIADDYKETSQASRDAISVLDRLSTLHDRARTKLLP
jgi:hypothetical protein